MKRVLLALFVMFAATAHAGTVEVYKFETPAQEARYKAMIAELRCLVCQNQNLADSNAELAQDLRQQTYEMIKRGATDQEIADFMVTRYGDFVLYRPPFKATTAFLWAGPFIILIAGLVVLLNMVRRRGRQVVAPLSDEAHTRARNLLEDPPEQNNQ